MTIAPLGKEALAALATLREAFPSMFEPEEAESRLDALALGLGVGD